MSAPPIACMLSGQDFKERLAWIADLNWRSLKSSQRNDLQLILTYARSALKHVTQMVERERACCPFLVFDVNAGDRVVTLSITAPEEAREAADDVFQPFLGGASKAGCSCCGARA